MGRREKRKRREGENCETGSPVETETSADGSENWSTARLSDKARERHVMFWKIAGVFPRAHWLEALRMFSSIDFVQQR